MYVSAGLLLTGPCVEGFTPHLWHYCEGGGSGKMAQRIKAFVAKHKDLGSIPRTHMMEGKNQLQIVF